MSKRSAILLGVGVIGLIAAAVSAVVEHFVPECDECGDECCCGEACDTCELADPTAI